ncbi:MAG: glucosaminidase domain-containing protein [Tannerella sp.]|jgi:LysM repeat protein|nr:glucosaminidase domain-containing protein [Tannerella sp.]
MRLAIRYVSLFILFTLTSAFHASGQKVSASYENYVKKYSQMAIQQEKEYGIPASITLGQALLESSGGQTPLAKSSNNHFGIKCHTADWRGDRVYKSDDKPNECFRKYKTVKESYEDHSKFLTERPRYAQLFKLKITDYKGWAKGLQDCGYATNRQYAARLIDIIETYQLYRYDSKVKSEKISSKQKKLSTSTSNPKDVAIARQVILPRDIYKSNGLIYVVADQYDSLERIAKDLNFKAKDLAKYNEILVNAVLKQGDIIYLQKKMKKAPKDYAITIHQVQDGETMYYISQRYGIMEKNLYKINKKKNTYIPVKGDILKLR